MMKGRELNRCDGNEMGIEQLQSHHQFCQSNDEPLQRISATDIIDRQHVDMRALDPFGCDKPQMENDIEPSAVTTKINCGKCGHKMQLRRFFTDTFR